MRLEPYSTTQHAKLVCFSSSEIGTSILPMKGLDPFPSQKGQRGRSTNSVVPEQAGRNKSHICLDLSGGYFPLDTLVEAIPP